jgi:hypothetical protein
MDVEDDRYILFVRYSNRMYVEGLRKSRESLRIVDLLMNI